MHFTGRFWILLCVVTHKVHGQDAVTCVDDGDTAVLSCGVTLTGGLTLRLATWRKLGPPDVTVADYVLGTSTAGPDYTGRASVNDTGFLLLERVTQADDGTYRCEATLSDFSSLPVVEDRVQKRGPPDMRRANVTATAETSTSAEVQWREPAKDACEDESSTYYVDYKLSSWQEVGKVVGSTMGNQTLSFVVTGLKQKGDYIFGVRAENSVGFSSRAESDPVSITGLPTGLPVWARVLIAILAVICVIAVALLIWWLITRAPTIELQPLSSRKVKVQWTAKCEGSYKVLYKLQGSKQWTYGPEVSTNDYTVDFPEDGSYAVCVQETILCPCCCHCHCCTVTSATKVVKIPVTDAESESLGGSNMPVSPLHGNNAPKNDLVFVITEGQSLREKLPPLVIDKQNPTEKGGKKKKKRKKVNRVHSSDEDGRN